jgi:hypothetical protein
MADDDSLEYVEEEGGVGAAAPAAAAAAGNSDDMDADLEEPHSVEEEEDPARPPLGMPAHDHEAAAAALARCVRRNLHLAKTRQPGIFMPNGWDMSPLVSEYGNVAQFLAVYTEHYTPAQCEAADTLFVDVSLCSAMCRAYNAMDADRQLHGGPSPFASYLTESEALALRLQQVVLPAVLVEYLAMDGTVPADFLAALNSPAIACFLLEPADQRCSPVDFFIHRAVAYLEERNIEPCYRSFYLDRQNGACARSCLGRQDVRVTMEWLVRLGQKVAYDRFQKLLLPGSTSFLPANYANMRCPANLFGICPHVSPGLRSAHQWADIMADLLDDPTLRDVEQPEADVQPPPPPRQAAQPQLPPRRRFAEGGGPERGAGRGSPLRQQPYDRVYGTGQRR